MIKNIFGSIGWGRARRVAGPTLGGGLLLLCALSMTPKMVFADIIQSVQDTQTSAFSGNGGTFYQELGTNLSGSATGVATYFVYNTLTTKVRVSLEECLGPAVYDNCGDVMRRDSGNLSASTLDSGGWTQDLGNGIVSFPLDPTRYYYLKIEGYKSDFSQFSDGFLGGASADLFSGGDCSKSAPFSPTSCSPVTDATFSLFGASATPPYEDSHIIDLTPGGFTSTTSPFAFHLTFHNGTTTPVLNACLQLYDEAIGGGNGALWRSACSALSFLPNQDLDFSQSFAAYPTGNWALHAQLIDFSGATIDATTTRFFITSDSSGYQNFVPSMDYATATGFLTIPQYTDSTFGTSTLLDTTNFLSFLNVPNLLKTKVPFAYIYQFASALTDTISSSTPTDIPSGRFSVVLPQGHSSTTISVDMFSTTTVTYFLTPPLISGLRGLMVAITFFSLGLFLFHDARDKRHLI